MIAQPSLFDPVPARMPRGVSIRADFMRFHRDNPQVYREIVRRARQAKAAGKSRWSIKSIYERVRWDAEIETDTDECWKLDNRFTALYARLVMQNEPDLAGFFELRERRAP